MKWKYCLFKKLECTGLVKRQSGRIWTHTLFPQLLVPPKRYLKKIIFKEFSYGLVRYDSKSAHVAKVWFLSLARLSSRQIYGYCAWLLQSTFLFNRHLLSIWRMNLGMIGAFASSAFKLKRCDIQVLLFLFSDEHAFFKRF